MKLNKREKDSQNSIQLISSDADGKEIIEFKSGQNGLSLMFALMTFPATVFSIFSVMMFDAPGSTNILITKILAQSILFSPGVLIVVAIGFKLSAYSKLNLRELKVARFVFLFFPAINLLIFLVFSFLLFYHCNGFFACTV